ncbi:profilin, required for normal timing of actin polymerization in response to thermal stress [Tulasnella sp. 417]|nr:profilin, required for normal timing of actin polymerization in response to thermal stress [Tulasnella sp. 417]
MQQSLANKGEYGQPARDSRYALSQAEQNSVVGAFNNLDNVRASGMTLAGTKYFTLQADPEHIYGKKGADGCILVKTKQAILVAVYKDPIQAPEATPVVEGLGDYLRGVNY